MQTENKNQGAVVIPSSKVIAGMTISLTADGPHEKPYVVTVGGLKMLYGEATAAAFVYQATDRAVVRAVGTLLDDLNRDFHAVIDMKINKVAAASQVG